MESLILIAVAVWVIKKGVESGHLDWFASRDANRASTRGRSVPRRAASAVQHDTGYWAHQVAHGFPRARQGLADGWHAGRMAQAEGKAARVKAKADHLALRARLIPELREHRRRQEEALGQIRAARVPQETGGSGGNGEGRQTGQRLTRRADGQPETDTDRRFFDLRESGYSGPVDQDGKPVMSRTDSQGNPLPLFEGGTGTGTPDDPAFQPEPATEEGTTMAADTTYDGVLRHVTQAQDFEEAAQSERTQWARRASQIAEDMQALHVDPDTLGAMADYLDAMQEAMKAQQKAMETAQAVKVALERGHKGLSEAHKDAPVEAADREFYAD